MVKVHAQSDDNRPAAVLGLTHEKLPKGRSYNEKHQVIFWFVMVPKGERGVWLVTNKCEYIFD